MHAAVISIQDVRRAVAGARPGRPAQERMSPRPRPGDRFPMPEIVEGKEAAVLLLIYEHADELCFFLTRRTETVASHKGQVSLPGGGREPNETLQETARREANEELGLDPARIEILGAPLTPLYIPVSEYWVTAFVGVYHGDPEVSAAADEVRELIPTPLATLLDPLTVVEADWELRGNEVRVPYFLIGGHQVWGATAMILSEFVQMLRDVKEE